MATLALLAAVGISRIVQRSPVLTLGDSAPKLEAESWLNGATPKKFGDGRLHVIEFWATWCGPCIDEMPHLAQLSQTYKGKIDFLGVNVWDRQPDENIPNSPIHAARIKEFLAGTGKVMTYPVAVDHADGRVAKAWLSAAERSGIPCSFVVNGDGKIAWIGHPAAIEPVLTALTNGTYNLTAEKNRYEEARRKAKAAKQAQMALRARLNALAAKRDFAGFYKEVTKFKTEPDAMLEMGISDVLTKNPEFAIECLEEAIRARTLKPFALAQLASFAAKEAKAPEWKQRAINVARRAVILASVDERAFVHGMLARTLVFAGRPAEGLVEVAEARKWMEYVKSEFRAGCKDFLSSIEKLAKPRSK